MTSASISTCRYRPEMSSAGRRHKNLSKNRVLESGLFKAKYCVDRNGCTSTVIWATNQLGDSFWSTGRHWKSSNEVCCKFFLVTAMKRSISGWRNVSALARRSLIVHTSDSCGQLFLLLSPSWPKCIAQLAVIPGWFVATLVYRPDSLSPRWLVISQWFVAFPPELFNLFKALYTDTVSCVWVDGFDTDWFQVWKVESGDSRSFLNPTDWLLNHTGMVGASLDTESFTDLDFTADMALLAEMLSVLVLALEIMRNQLASPWTGLRPRSSHCLTPHLWATKVTIKGHEVELMESFIHDLPNGNTFNDLEWPLIPISRSRHFSTWISQKRHQIEP